MNKPNELKPAGDPITKPDPMTGPFSPVKAQDAAASNTASTPKDPVSPAVVAPAPASSTPKA